MNPSIAECLAAARAAGLDRLDAQLLLAHHLRRSRVWLLAHDDSRLTAAQQSAFAADCRRRADGVPLAYLLGEREFHGLVLKVNPAVLVPRPDTETLVEWALQVLAGPLADRADVDVIDLGTGSGAVALAIKHAAARARVCASDCSGAALAVARANARAHRLAVEFVASDWWQSLAQRRFHLALSNPPYIAAGDPHLAALQHEPTLALTPGGDGLSALRKIVKGAPEHLFDGGWLLLEHGHDQAEAVRACLKAAGFGSVQTRSDLAGRKRCSGGQWLLRA